MTRSQRKGDQGVVVGRVTTEGRLSGNPHTVPLRLLPQDGSFFCAADSWERDWCKNVVENPRVVLRVQGEAHEAWISSEDIDPETKREVLEELSFGGVTFTQDDPVFEITDLEPADVGYSDLLETAFDEVSSHYDPHIEESFINKYVRFNSVYVMKQLFQEGDVVLDVGCGTGMESLQLAATGVNIVGVDISDEMLRRFEEKAQELDLDDRVRLRKLSTSDLGDLVGFHGEGHFDGAFSNFGAMNLEPELWKVPQELHRLIKEGGAFVTAVWNKYCLFEIFAYGATGRPRKATRRVDGRRDVGVRHHSVPTYFYSVGDIERLFSQHFEVVDVRGLPVFLPPPELDPYYETVRGFTRILEEIDVRMAGRFPFKRLGDHSLITMRRK